MEHIKKLYGKAYHLYTIEDWKYIFSILKEKDKYNHTEEEFLAAELIDKTAMMKKMDEAIWKNNPFNKQSMDINESIFEPCPRDGGCKVIQDFLEEEVDEWEIIKNQYDLAFKDKKRLLIIREFAEQQLRDVDADLTAVNINISMLDDRYRKYRDNALTNKDFK